MEIVLPAGVELADLPPAPPPPAGGYGWGSMAATASTPRRATSSIAIVLGLVAVVTYLVSLVMIVGSESPTVPSGALMVMFLVLWASTFIFWLWMLIDAISDSRVGWALLILFLGVIPALLYALFGRSRTASY